MNIKKLLIGYSVLLLALLALFLYLFQNAGTVRRDMVYYNDICRRIEAALESGEPVELLEKIHGCEILLMEDKDYEHRLNEALQREALIMDCNSGDHAIIGKILWTETEKSYERMRRRLFGSGLAYFLVLAFAGYILLVYDAFAFVRPFHTLQHFSRQVAKGNLDFPLAMRKHNYFGAFTESFDLMREELKQARESEYRANQSKKELVAELSHDIKTPVSTILAACEVLEVRETKPDTVEKIGIIRAKAVLIDKLVKNLFHATLEELEVLKVEPTEESSLEIRRMLAELGAYGEVETKGELPECLVYMDTLRLEQVIDNCVNNAWKYAHSAASVSFAEEQEGIILCIRDHGAGVPEEELPRVTEKFYRGSNAKGREGSGLGLYLAKLFMEQMKGGIACRNEDGFVVELFLRKV